MNNRIQDVEGDSELRTPEESDMTLPHLGDTNFRGPLLVTGASRSGTSYLRRVANFFDAVHLEYEIDILRDAHEYWQKHDVLKDRAAFDDFVQFLKTIKRSNTDFKSFNQDADFYDELFAEASEHRNFARCMESLYRLRHHHVIWGDKCELAQVNTFFELYPDSRLLYIVRDPRAVVSSFYEHSGVNYVTTSMAWVNSARHAQKLLQEYGEDKVRVIHYADLFSNFKGTAEEIGEFIGQPMPDNFDEQEVPNPASITKWRNRLTDAQVRRVEEICFDEMQAYGIEPEFATEKKNVGQVQYAVLLVQHIFALAVRGKIGWGGIRNKIPRFMRYLGFHRKW